MKWLLFTSACVVVLVGLGILAVDERNVEWEGRKALCPYCRAEVAYDSVVCPACDRSFDWRSNKEECRWCLDRADVDRLLGLYRELTETGPLPESLAAWGPYFEAIESGKCTYCGGIGRMTEGGKEVTCPVCRGDTRCIACGGSRSVVIGDEGAHRRALERIDERVRTQERSAVAGLPIDVELLIQDDVSALRGYAEAETLRDANGSNLLELARERVKSAFRVLHDEQEKRAKQTRGS